MSKPTLAELGIVCDWNRCDGMCRMRGSGVTVAALAYMFRTGKSVRWIAAMLRLPTAQVETAIRATLTHAREMRAAEREQEMAGMAEMARKAAEKTA